MINDDSGYIQHYQVLTEEYMRITQTVWAMMGIAYASHGLQSQFRIDLSWNTDYGSDKLFDLFVEKLNYAFENESNNEKNYRIIVNTLRVLFDDWNLEYSFTRQRCPAPLFYSEQNIYEAVKIPEYTETKTVVEIDERTKLPIKKEVYIHHEEEINYTYYNPRLDKNNKDTFSLMADEKRQLCFRAFLKGIIFGFYNKEMDIYFSKHNAIPLTLYSNSFAASLHQLLLDYQIDSEYDFFEKNNFILIKNKDDFLNEIIDFNSGFYNEFEPPILIRSPRRGIG